MCDGSGEAAVRADVAVTGGRIETVGRVAERGAREIDAGGLVVAPGFIDLHYPGYLDALEAQGVGVNVASFIGHSAVRVRVMGEAAMERAATSDELAAMVTLIRDGMAAGAIGWSTAISCTECRAASRTAAASR